MNKNKRSIVAVLLSLIMILSLGMGVVTVGAQNNIRSTQTIDGTDRERGISQIQTVIPDKVFAAAVYDSLEREDHWGDGIQSVKEVLSSCDGYVEYQGWKMLQLFTVRANKVKVSTGVTDENIEEVFLTEAEAQAFYDTLTDTAEYCYLDKRIDLMQQSTGTLKDDEELIHDITGIEWLRNMHSIDLSYNKIADLSPLDIDHIAELAEEAGEMAPDVLTGEKWYRSYGENLYFDFRGNPIRKYPECTAGRLEWPRLESASFELEVGPYVIIKEDGADKKYDAEIEIPLIERAGTRIDIRPNGCRIIQNDIPGSEITEWTKEKILLNGLTHSGIVKIGIEGADNSQISSYVVDEWDMSTIGSSTLKFLFDQYIRIYNLASVMPVTVKAGITLEKTEEGTDEPKLLEGAVFRLYKAEITDGVYVPKELYTDTDYITDENGKITIEEELPAGDYCLVEEEAPEHYIVEKTPYGFSLGGKVTLTGGTPEVTSADGAKTKAVENVTYIDRYSPEVSLTVTPAAGNTLEKIVLTYFDRQKQDSAEITFNESDGNATEAAENWINLNKGDKDNIGLIDGSISLRVDFSHAPINFKATNKGTGGITVSKTVSGDRTDKTQKFSFTVTLDDSTVNGIYGEMNFVNGVASFELADGESISASGLTAGTGYMVTETGSDDYTVTAENAEGIVKTAEMIAVLFNNHKEESETSGGTTDDSSETGPSEESSETKEPETTGDSDVTDEAESSNKPGNPIKPEKPSDSGNPGGNREPSVSDGQETSVGSDGNVPDTADKTDVILWFTLFAVSALGLALMPFMANKQQ